MTLTLLRGHRTIGGSIVSLVQKGRGFLIDFGMNFATHSDLFEALNTPRAACGLLDYWQVGLVPRLEGIYREDLMPIGHVLKGEELPVEGVLISHGHADHFQNVSLLRHDLELHCSAITAAVLKSAQVSGASNVNGEVAALVPRRVSNYDARALTSPPASTPANARPLKIFSGPVTSELSTLWNSPCSSSDRARQVIPAHVEPSSGELAGMKYTAHPVDHSIFGCCGFVVQTEIGPIAYTADLRLGGSSAHLTRAFIKHLAKIRPRILICEGTTVGRENQRVVTEADVFDRALDIVRQSDGKLVIADFGTRHIERARSFLRIASECNRKLAVSCKDMHLLSSVALAEPCLNICDHPDLVIFDEIRAMPAGWERDLRRRFADKLVTAQQIKDDQGAFIMAASYWDMTELVSIEPKNPVWIYSGSEAYSEDARVDLYRLTRWIHLFGGTLHGFEWRGNETGRADFGSDRLNASGHIDAKALAQLLLEVKPKICLPNHTSSPEWFEEVLRNEPCQVLTGPADGPISLTL